MVLKPEVIARRLEELDWTLQRLARHRDVSIDHYESDPDLQWIVERGLLNAAGLIFDVSDHVLSGHFGKHPETYQGSLDGLQREGVISSELHGRLQGLGGFRNLLVHEYLELDPSEVLGHLRRAFRVFPQFAREILAWMEGLEEEVR